MIKHGKAWQPRELRGEIPLNIQHRREDKSLKKFMRKMDTAAWPIIPSLLGISESAHGAVLPCEA